MCTRVYIKVIYVHVLCASCTVEHGAQGGSHKRHKEHCRRRKKREAGKHRATRIPLSTEYRDQYKKWPLMAPDKVGLVVHNIHATYYSNWCVVQSEAIVAVRLDLPTHSQLSITTLVANQLPLFHVPALLHAGH